MVVRVGETIDWTLHGFHNRVGRAVNNFTIIDIPSRGLNFIGGNFPAFSNSEGVTLEIRYTVYGSNEWHTYRTGIDASRPFAFALPQPGDLFYTQIGFFFGTVPVDFGLGDEIVLTFLVSADAPNNRLVNHFIMGYENNVVEGQSPDRPLVLPPDEPSEHEVPGGTPGDIPPPLTLPPVTTPDEVTNQTLEDEDAPTEEIDPSQLGNTGHNNEINREEQIHQARTNPQTGDIVAATTSQSILGAIGVFAALLLVGKKVIEEK